MYIYICIYVYEKKKKLIYMYSDAFMLIGGRDIDWCGQGGRGKRKPNCIGDCTAVYKMAVYITAGYIMHT